MSSHLLKILLLLTQIKQTKVTVPYQLDSQPGI